MSRRGADCAILLGVCILGLTVAGLLLPLHQLSFFEKGSPFATVKLYSVGLRVDGSGRSFKKTMPKVHPLKFEQKQQKPNAEREYNAQYLEDKKWLESSGFARSTNIMVFQRNFCARTLYALWPTICHGLSGANSVGIMLIGCSVVSGLLVQGLCGYLLYDYSRRKPSRRTRVAAEAAFAFGLGLNLWVQAQYSHDVTWEIDRTEAAAPHISALLGSSKISGCSIGLHLLGAAIVLQVVQSAVVCFFVKSSYEDALEAMQQRQAPLQEQIKTHYGAFDPQRPSQAGFEDFKRASMLGAAEPWNSEANAGPPRVSRADGALLGVSVPSAAAAPMVHRFSTLSGASSIAPSHSGLGVGQGVAWFGPAPEGVAAVQSSATASGATDPAVLTVVVHEPASMGGQMSVTRYPSNKKPEDPTPPQELLGKMSVAEGTW